MIIQVYLEDRDTGRSPSAMAIDTAPLKAVPICNTTDPVERLGRLCLRHPLPAVVFADRAHGDALFQIADTITTLGFDMPIFVSPRGIQPIDEQTTLITGSIFIPVPDAQTGDRWGRSSRIRAAICKGSHSKAVAAQTRSAMRGRLPNRSRLRAAILAQVVRGLC